MTVFRFSASSSCSRHCFVLILVQCLLLSSTRSDAQEPLAPVVSLELLAPSSLVSLHADRTLCDWKLTSQPETGAIIAQFVKSRANAMLASKNVVAILEPRNNIVFLDLRTKKEISHISREKENKSISHVCFSLATNIAALATTDGNVSIYRNGTRQPKVIANPNATPKLPHETVRLAFTPDGTRLLVLSCPNPPTLRTAVGAYSWLQAYYLTIYNVDTDRFERQFEQDDKFSFYDMSISPGGKYLASANQFGTGYLWDFPTGRRILTFSKKDDKLINQPFAQMDDNLINLWFANEGHSLIFGTYKGAASIWEVATGKERFCKRTGYDYVTAAAQSKMLLAMGSVDGSIKVWNLPQLVLDEETLGKRSFSAKDIDYVWGQLVVDDAKEAFKGVLTIAFHAKIFVGWLKDKLPRFTKKEVQAYIAALDQASFAEREKATQALMSVGPFFLSELERSRDRTSSPEVKKRIGLILDKGRDETKRYIRLIEAMEISDFPEASTILDRLANLDGLIGNEAEASRNRMKKSVKTGQ